MAEIVVIACHPDLARSRVNRRLVEAAAATPGVDLRVLDRLYPDFHVDVAAEQQALAAAKLVAWVHPIHWYSMPPRMKLWLDEVFALGWAYGPGGRALAGKDLWLVASTGGTDESYAPTGHHRYYFDEFLHPYEQTAALAGMRWLPPMLLHGAHRVADAEIAAHAAVFAERLRDYPRWPELSELAAEPACDVPADERPALAD